MGFFLGLPVSGLTVPASVLTARVRGPIWLTGGEYGPEGGLLAIGTNFACDRIPIVHEKHLYE